MKGMTTMSQHNEPHNPGLSPQAWDKLHRVMSEILRNLAVRQAQSQEKKGA